MSRPDLRSELSHLTFAEASSDWDGYEVNIGYGVMNQPMSSGDQLALRVFPHSDFGGYISVWHRPPDGGWAQYVDRAPVEAGCPRVWGPALVHAGAASIDANWTGPHELEVTMDRPALRWQVTMSQTWPLAMLNRLHAPLPLSTWRHRWLVDLRERALRMLGLGPVSLSGIAPSGERLVAALRRLYWVESSRAELDGRDLGSAAVMDRCPTIGDWPLPRRGVFAIGEAHGSIGDRREYERLRHEAATHRGTGRGTGSRRDDFEQSGDTKTDEEEPMTGGVPDPTEVVRRAFEALNDRDRGTFLDLHAEEVVLHVGDATIRGARSVREEEWAHFDAFPDLTVEPDQIITENGTVAVRWTATGTHQGGFRGIEPTGERVEYQLSGMFRVDDGRITEVWLVADRLALLQQIGAVDALTG